MWSIFINGTTAGNLYAFNISAGGVIGAQIGSPVPPGIAPGGIVIDPTGALIAVDNNVDNDISLYTVGTGGAITATTPPTVAAGQAPFGITFYVANQKGTCNLSPGVQGLPAARLEKGMASAIPFFYGAQ